MKLLRILFICLLLFPGLASAVDSNGNYAVWGLGKKSCFAYMKTSEEEKGPYKNYMKGFITSYNIFTEKTYSISGKMDENQILEWIEEYCVDNQMSSFENALLSFTFDHYDKRMKSAGGGFGR